MAGIFWERNAPALSEQKIAEIEKISIGAPSLTHLRGKAAIVSSRDAALRLKFGTPGPGDPYLGLRIALPRGRAKEGSTVVSTVNDTGVAVLIGKRTPLCG